ncbi:hypothetical protein ACQEU5_05605 [Marinactinospora thermotolerans]|uniref:Uncharacterized protein n=1 Tax=Marinactinospora thermotolerans DSM 45154 TaxID=1122192 RepID=A0A1T4TF81_9ACTN|nr:hypothetical protein [Marinactinospora thermotolerans]SKA39133.1 hypothetical protein SAMN02745673_04933 [Marinactinospora thermotolerans DSM 45154]
MRVDVSRIVDGDVLELELLDRTAEDAHLLLLPTGKNKGVVEAIPLPLDIKDGTAHADLARAEIPPGTWVVRWVEAGKKRPIITSDPCYDVAEVARALSRPAGRRHLPLRTSDGRLRIQVRQTRPYARIERVDVAESEITLAGILAYGPALRGPAELVARQRGLSGELRVPATVDGSRFGVTVPLAPLADAHVLERPHNEWDLTLVLPDSGTDLHVGTHDDDIVGRKGRFSYPEVLVESASGRLRVRPYYTVKDHLAILAVANSPAEAPA